MDISDWVEVKDEDSYSVTLAKDVVCSIAEFLRSLMNTIVAIPIGMFISWIDPQVVFAISSFKFSFVSVSLIQYALGFWLIGAIRDFMSNPKTDLR